MLALQPGVDLLLLEKVRDWVMKPIGQGAEVPVRVSVQGRSLEVDPRNTKLAPGTYQLAGRWDFEQLKVAGIRWIRWPPHSLPRLQRIDWLPLQVQCCSNWKGQIFSL